MRLIKYLLVGGVAACVDIGLFMLFTSHWGYPWLPVSITSFVLATLTNYFLSIHFVFESGIRYQKHHEIVGVFLVSTLALLINQLILYITITQWLWPLLLCKITATGTVFFWNYFGRSRWVFKAKRSKLPS